jgi:hypothetical protein
MIPSVPEAKWDSDDRRPPTFRPIEPRVEIARGADWSIMVSRSQDAGFCITNTDSGGDSGVAHGRLPGPGSRSKHVVAIVGRPVASRKEAVGFVTGLVTANVARVEVELRDDTVISAQTEAAPDALDADLRTFVITTPFDEQPLGPDFAPWVREYVLRASDGRGSASTDQSAPAAPHLTQLQASGERSRSQEFSGRGSNEEDRGSSDGRDEGGR